ncbi:Holliday junction resolvase RuvX [Thermanaerovibrio acidaminovorans]|jgi:putative Holliday junction resolvase|uniref:Putative pre-16S rRNA nuclease n=1 Tax=Thermanaerovibrio acidaminovorans (strain ATCC 49978 / DSM 6589 / Su883) TaxID=525903 RepID=D1B5H3_THEAS|nr:Holliday junction resolvase RuvX [Thermanaerovibrio acidaminovorans]ACZ19264.1 Holliday junction resolvase YqgF [Thermanaerovibrio acidaminovorans DSM 6589]
MDSSMGRVMALDLGEVRIGVALSDPSRSFASPLEVLKMEEGWPLKVKELVERNSVTLIVVGLPIRTDGSSGPEVQRVMGWLEELKAVVQQVEIVTVDERFTTSIAQRFLLEGDVRREKRKGKVDKVAAALMLQDYLNSRRGS